MKCIRVLFSVCLSSFLRSRSWSWCECGKRPVGTGTDGTPAGRVWLSDRTSVFLPWKTKNKRLALRARVPHCKIRLLYYGKSCMPGQQYYSTAGAGRPTPQQPSYGGDLYGKARLPVSVYRGMSPLTSKKNPHGSTV